MTSTTPPMLDSAPTPLRQDPPVKAVRKAFSSPIASVAVFLIVVLWTIPTFGLLINSIRPKEDAETTGWWDWFTNFHSTFSNYNSVLFAGSSGTGGNLISYMANSLAITIPATIIPIFLASMAAYALAWIPFKGSSFIFFTLFALQVVPLQMALIPLSRLYTGGAHVSLFGTTYVIFPDLHLSGSFAEIWISHTMFSLPLAVFLLHNFISQLPDSVIEAARVDGASYLRIYRTIVLPLSTPAIASFAIFQFIWVWNDLLVALTFGGNDPNKAPVTAQLANLIGNFGSHLELLSAGGFISIVVPMIVFFALQRFFVRGLLAGSVKG
jgi:alpha-glucoside transport system permease protein